MFILLTTNIHVILDTTNDLRNLNLIISTSFATIYLCHHAADLSQPEHNSSLEEIKIQKFNREEVGGRRLRRRNFGGRTLGG